MKSEIREIGKIVFPENIGERIYMLPFTKQQGLPESAKRWQSTVDQMLVGVETDGPIYLMIDQGFVKAGNSHRRPGLHIDGNWIEENRCHGGGGGSHHHRGPDMTDELIILASDVIGCRAYAGDFTGLPGENGDCYHIVIDGLEKIDLSPYKVYAGNVSMLHESIPVDIDCMRTMIRLNVPGGVIRNAA